MSRTRDTPAGPARQGRRPSDDSSRRLAFATFVTQALTGAREQRAWTGAEVARRTGLSRQTLHRWVRGDWTNDPEPARVAVFCETLGVAPRVAFAILGWDRTPGVARPAARATDSPPSMDPDVEALLRRLNDPRVSAEEKYHIRETIRFLAYRPTVAAPGGSRGSAGGPATSQPDTSTERRDHRQAG